MAYRSPKSSVSSRPRAMLDKTVIAIRHEDKEQVIRFLHDAAKSQYAESHMAVMATERSTVICGSEDGIPVTGKRLTNLHLQILPGAKVVTTDEGYAVAQATLGGSQTALRITRAGRVIRGNHKQAARPGSTPSGGSGRNN